MDFRIGVLRSSIFFKDESLQILFFRFQVLGTSFFFIESFVFSLNAYFVLVCRARVHNEEGGRGFSCVVPHSDYNSDPSLFFL